MKMTILAIAIAALGTSVFLYQPVVAVGPDVVDQLFRSMRDYSLFDMGILMVALAMVSLFMR